MSDDTKFVRNKRPNKVNIRVNGIKLSLERRGSRADTAAVPGSAWTDQNFLQNFRRNVLEEINKDQFMALATRIDDDPPQPRLVAVNSYDEGNVGPVTSLRDGIVVFERQKPEGTNEDGAPLTIWDTKFDKESKTPKVDFVEFVPTEEDVAEIEAELLAVDEPEEEEILVEVPVVKKSAGRPKKIA